MAEHQRYLYGAEAEEAPGGVKRDPFAPKHLSQPDYDRIQLLAKSGDAEWLDVQTVALVMGVSKWTIYRAIKRGEIPFVRIGRGSACRGRGRVVQRMMGSPRPP